MAHGVSQKYIDHKTGRRKELFSELERDCSNIDLDLFPVRDLAETMILLDPQAAMVETWESWTAAMQLHSAVFALSEAEKGSVVECLIDHKVRRLKAPGMLYCADPDNWENAFLLAVVCRDNARAEALCRVPVERLRQAAEGAKVTYNEYTYHWISALQAYVNGTPDLVDELRRAMELSSPSRGAFGGDALDLLAFPPMEVFRRLLMGDSDKFNEALVYALESHKRYYDERKDDNRVRGIVPLSLLAWACLAYDKSQRSPDFRLEVESEYLPKHLVERSWYGEFPV